VISLRPLLLAAAVFGLASSEPGDESASSVGSARWPLQSCRLPGLDEEAWCGRFPVFEDRAAGRGRKIELNVAVLKATGALRGPDAVVPLAGGPGAAVVADAAGTAALLKDLRASRDILLVDGRGTGGSHPLNCPYQTARLGAAQQLETFLPPDGVRECLTALEGVADPRFYTTPYQADDLDELRQALGYSSLDLVGTSYGTRSALVYMRQHPDHVRTAVLWGLAPTDLHLPESFARDAQDAFDGWVAECRDEPPCREAFPDPAADLRAVLARLEQGPVTVSVAGAGGAPPRDFVLSRNGFVQTLRYMLYLPESALRIPLLLRQAARGDWAALAKTADTLGSSFLGGTADGLYLSVTCSEDVPFVDDAASRRQNAGTFLGDFRLDRQKDSCRSWPRGALPEGYGDPVRSKAPALLFSGERDPVTPPRRAEGALPFLSRGRHIVIADGGHDIQGLQGVECADALIARFIEAGSAEGLDTSCLAGMRRPPFALR